MDPIKAIIIDDEREAGDNLQNLLIEHASEEISILGVAENTIDGALLISTFKPDAVFLDIEMPEENAFQFLERINPYDFEVVFVTAFDEFAIKAFKLNAVDYILKPLCIEELIQSVERLKAQLHFRSFTRNKISQLSALAQISQKELTQKITLKSLNHVEVVEFKDIYAIEGQGNYCRVSFNKGGAAKDMVTSNLISYFEDLLPRNAFYRVHKSYLINCMHIESITSGESYYVDVKNNLKIPVSRRRFSDFIAFLKKNSFYGG